MIEANSMPVTCQYLAQGVEPTIFSDIYQEDIHIAIWQRELSASLQDSVKDFSALNPTFRTERVVTPQNALASLCESFGADEQAGLRENIAELVEMFCYLFDLKRAGLRLKILDHAMCPKFHVDRIPCRLVTTYQGVATEWLPHEVVNRTKLGEGADGQADHQSGLYPHQHDIQQLNCGDVALLKGVLWQGNENAGLVHRSPKLANQGNRLLLTLDFID
jgi:hypothetical protein